MLSITDKSAAFSYSTLSRSFAAALVVHLSLQNDENAECFMYNFWPTAELMVTRTTHRRRWKSRALMTSLEVYTWATQKSSRRNFFGETVDGVGPVGGRGVLQVSIVLRVVVLVMEAGVTRRPMHHLCLSVHHVTHGGSIRAVSSTWTCMWGKDRSVRLVYHGLHNTATSVDEPVVDLKNC